MDELNAKEFIFNFFDKNFLIHVNESKFEVKDKRTNTILSEYEFFSFVGVVFVGLVPNDFIGIKTVTEEWYNQHKKNLIRDILSGAIEPKGEIFGFDNNNKSKYNNKKET